MKLQFRITALIAVNYLAAIYFADSVGATLFLFLFQPVIILAAGKMLNAAIPAAIRSAARENYRRLDGSFSDRRRALEMHQARHLQLKLYSLLSLVTLAMNLAIGMIQTASEYLNRPVLSTLLITVLILVGLFEFTRQCYLNFIRRYVEQVGERHMQYVQLDLDRTYQLEDNDRKSYSISSSGLGIFPAQ